MHTFTYLFIHAFLYTTKPAKYLQKLLISWTTGKITLLLPTISKIFILNLKIFVKALRNKEQ